MAPKEDKLTREEIAALAKCSLRTVARAIAHSEITTTKEHGLILATRSEAQRWIAERQARRRRRQPAYSAARTRLARTMQAELRAVVEIAR